MSASLLTAHPRSRGENLLAYDPQISRPGSSPLTRGKRGTWTGAVPWTGLIPAHAGKTRPQVVSRRADAAHPRSRGENPSDMRAITQAGGSSPLTRGKQAAGSLSVIFFRLIPAHAGKTSSGASLPHRLQAHPRSRGENRSTMSAPRGMVGSSPLTRGKPEFFGACEARLRLIPAHAGKTCCGSCPGSGRPAHPRSRGENVISPFAIASRKGSSPLTRGKPNLTTAMPAGMGLIPAHAGKTTIRKGSNPWTQAHPRSRGENTADDALTAQPAGSSPLTRGKL